MKDRPFLELVEATTTKEIGEIVKRYCGTFTDPLIESFFCRFAMRRRRNILKLRRFKFQNTELKYLN
jgi:hypothetical protein